jgi:Outer membrane protein beta-barrel domain
MKKNTLFLLIAILFMGYPLLAQFGLQAGAVFSSAKEKYQSNSMEFGTQTGFTFGLFYRKDFGGKFAFQPEINFIQRGGKYTETIEGDGETMDMDIDLNLNYLEVPLYFLYNGGKKSGIYAGLGPSFNWGLSGKVDYDGESEDIKFGDDEDLKRFFLGINGLVGYQMENGFTVNGFVSQSLTNSDTETEADATFSMLSFGIRLGYMIDLNKTATVKLKPAL